MHFKGEGSLTPHTASFQCTFLFFPLHAQFVLVSKPSLVLTLWSINLSVCLSELYLEVYSSEADGGKCGAQSNTVAWLGEMSPSKRKEIQIKPSFFPLQLLQQSSFKTTLQTWEFIMFQPCGHTSALKMVINSLLKADPDVFSSLNVAFQHLQCSPLIVCPWLVKSPSRIFFNNCSGVADFFTISSNSWQHDKICTVFWMVKASYCVLCCVS